MGKINRRDYLMQMGLTTGVMVGGPAFDLFAQRRNPVTDACLESQTCKPVAQGVTGSSQQIERSVEPQLWHPRACEFPAGAQPNETIKLIFSGLIGFCAREVEENGMKKVYCDVGFHRKPDSYHTHRFRVRAYEQRPQCQEVYPNSIKEDINHIALSVPNPKYLDQVYFYQPKDACSRDKLDDKDFRWIIDFESDYLYGEQIKTSPKVLPKKKNVYRPVLSVPRGIFYTIRKTASTFRVQTADGSYVNDLNNVADVQGANLYLNAGDSVTLTINGKAYAIRAPGEIYLFNHCETGSACKPQPYNIKDKKKRSDFYLHYEGFDRGSFLEYEMFLLQSHNQTLTMGNACPLPKMIFEDIRISDEAPCAAGGFGGGKSGLP